MLRALFVLAIMAGILWGCDARTSPQFVRPTPKTIVIVVTATPAPRPTAAPTATAMPTPRPTATARPTATPRPARGLGISADTVREIARELGFIIRTRSDRIEALGGTVNLEIYPPWHDLSRARLTWTVDADVFDVVDVTALLILLTGDGDFSWIAQDFVDGKTPRRTFGDVQARAEIRRDSRTIVVTITPK